MNAGLAKQLEDRLSQVMLRDRFALRQRLRRARGERELREIASDIDRSVSERDRRQKALPRVTYPQDLPVVQHRDQIRKLIADNQVLVLAGETGSGKTTQLPKICLELGRGVAGMIGHTQPRRIAARSVAMRLAQELDSPLGHAVGYKVRFSDKLSENTFVKLMTDGILLAETQTDRFLDAYDTIIIDEAHERSLNIDFLLGYIKQLLPKRPDLKLIITSATIDPQRFGKHFGDAPVLEVSGRTYPVEVRYRPPPVEDETDEPDMVQAILDAVDEVWRAALATTGPKDVLVFLPGEREIRETAEALRKHHPPGTEILPLYARLSADEQMKVFAPHPRPRIVLATNVAETSLTVPGIRYVVDPGLARLSRYSFRTKVQRLPIEKISQASANQRAGRCGRVAPGICIRLYNEEDFASREPFTDPEILRTNLASVILQMKAFRLGNIEEFPFVEPPDYRMVRDGYQTLHEIGALNDEHELTDIGRQLARLPVDPRIGRMILAGVEERCLDEILIIASALSIQDPRERPLEKQQAADEAHVRFRDESSDFLSYLKLWAFWREQYRHLSQSKLRKLCKQLFLSYTRLREWNDVHTQLAEMTGELLHGREKPSRPRTSTNETFEITQVRYDAIHRALLTGLLGNIGVKGEQAEYQGPRNMRFHLFPGSALFKSKPQWVMAAEIVETTKLYARTVARIQPQWVEAIAPHLVKKTHSEPRWQPDSAHVIADEKVTLYGLTLVPRRTVHFGPIDPKSSREIFIQHALVLGEYKTAAPWYRHNQKHIEEIESLEAKQRNRNLMVDLTLRYAFFDARIPEGITNGPLFEKWRRDAERKTPRLLFMEKKDLLAQEAQGITADQYPDKLAAANMTLPLEYRLEPGTPIDGVTVTVPLAGLNQVREADFDWLVPGLLKEKIVALIRTLPKGIRTNFVPVPDWADKCLSKMKFREGPLLETLASCLGKLAGVVIRPADWRPQEIPEHLRMNFRVIDEKGNEIAMGRDLSALKSQLQSQIKSTFAAMPQSTWSRERVTKWDFGDLPPRVEIRRNGMTIQGFPAIVDKVDSVSLAVLDSESSARAATRAGVRRLFMLDAAQEIRYLQRNIPDFHQMALNYSTLGTAAELKDQLLQTIADRALYSDGGDIRTQEEFQRRADKAWHRLNPLGASISALTAEILASYQQVLRAWPRNVPPSWSANMTDLKQQLAYMMPKNFLLVTPPQWLEHVPRFLKGIHARLQKLQNAGHAKDSEKLAQIAPLWQQYLARRTKHQKEGIADPESGLYRWMLEEFRISLFAQELKTSIPISLKRLEQQWAKVRP